MLTRKFRGFSRLSTHSDSKVHGAKYGAHLGPTGSWWAPRWALELCYLGTHRESLLFSPFPFLLSTHTGYLFSSLLPNPMLSYPIVSILSYLILSCPTLDAFSTTDVSNACECNRDSNRLWVTFDLNNVCLVPSCYLNQCWFITKKTSWNNIQCDSLQIHVWKLLHATDTDMSSLIK